MPSGLKVDSFACPACKHRKSEVIDTRARLRQGFAYNYVRRRRRCLNCGYRQTTYETTKEPKSLITEDTIKKLHHIRALFLGLDL